MRISMSTFEKLANDNLVRSFFRDQMAEGELPTSLAEAVASAVRGKSKLYQLVTAERLSGRSRVYTLFADVKPAWGRCGSTISYKDVEYQVKAKAEISGFYLTVPAVLTGCYIDGSANQIEAFVFALAGPMARALDQAILYSEGSTDAPKGIIPQLAEDHVVTLADGSGGAHHGQALYNAMAAAADLCKKPSYETDTFFGAVASRKTVSALLREIESKEAHLPEYVPQLLAKIAISDDMADGDVLFGYMKAYRLYERGNYSAGYSALGPGFIEDKLRLKVQAVFDAALAEPECFVLVNINGMEPTTSIPGSNA